MRAALVIAVLGVPSAFAAQVGDPDDLFSIEIHGFASQGFIYSTHQNSYLAKSRTGSFEFTEIGLNFTKQLFENLRFGLQLFSRDLGPLGNYTIKPDWYYLDYTLRDWFGMRAGRVKLPFGLYNDTSDIDAARTAVILPPSVYPTQNRDYLLAMTGVELYGRLNLGAGGALAYSAYGGTIFIDLSTDRTAGAVFDLLEFNIPYIIGGRVMWETPIDGLRIGGSAQTLRLDARLQTRTTPPVVVSAGVPVVLWVASLEYAAHDLLIAMEYSRWHSITTSSNPAVVPASYTESERGYVMLSYRVNSWFQPGIYYSMLYPNIQVRKTRANEQHDLAATLRFDINEYWLVKLEGHFMSGTAGLSTTLNEGRPLTQLAPYWGAFFAKTTVHF